MTWDQLVIMILGPAAVALSYTSNQRTRRWGPVLGLMGQVAWFYTLYVHAQWGAFIAGFAYTLSWTYGFYKEWKCLLQNWTGLVTFWWSSEVSMTKRLQPSVPMYESSSQQKPVELRDYRNGCVNYTSQATAHIDRRSRLGC